MVSVRCVACVYVLVFVSTGQVGAGREQGWLSRMAWRPSLTEEFVAPR
jgi:hypothetical protein